MGIIAFILIGLVAGLIARALLPGRQPMGLLATTVLGMVGSLVGGFVASVFHPNQPVFSLHPTGLIMSCLGALMVLLVVTMVGRRRAI